MQILFEKSHPKTLVEALQKVHQADYSHRHRLAFYDKTIEEKKLKQPVLFLFDYSKKGFAPTTEELFNSGYRVFALKTKLEEKLDFFDLSLTIIGLWPAVVKIVNNNSHPFIYTYKYCGTRLKKAKE